MGTSDFGLHKILIYAMKSREGKGRKYLEKEKEENIWRRKIIFWWRSRRMEKEEKENIWRMKFILAEEKKENCCGRTGRDQRLYKRSSLT